MSDEPKVEETQPAWCGNPKHSSQPHINNGDCNAPAKPKKRRGFACMSKERVAEIASLGGKAAHAAGTAHQFSYAEAKEAGRKGGFATRDAKKRKKAKVAS